MLTKRYHAGPTVIAGPVSFMTAAEINTLIGTIFSGLAALVAAGGVFLGVLNKRKIDENLSKTQELHISTNSRMDQLLLLARAGALAEGINQGRAEVHAEGRRDAAETTQAAAGAAAEVLKTAAETASKKVSNEKP